MKTTKNKQQKNLIREVLNMEKQKQAKEFTQEWLKKSKEYRESFEHRLDNAFMNCKHCGMMTANIEQRKEHEKGGCL